MSVYSHLWMLGYFLSSGKFISSRPANSHARLRSAMLGSLPNMYGLVLFGGSQMRSICFRVRIRMAHDYSIESSGAGSPKSGETIFRKRYPSDPSLIFEWCQSRYMSILAFFSKSSVGYQCWARFRVRQRYFMMVCDSNTTKPFLSLIVGTFDTGLIFL